MSCLQYPARLGTLRPSPAVGAFRRPLEFLERLARQGDVVPFRLGRRRAVLLNHPDHVSTVLVTEASRFRKGAANQRAKHLLGNGLLTADTALHAERRKILQPAFARARLEACAADVVARTSAMCDGWSSGRRLDLTGEIGRLTFAIVCDAIAGIDGAGDFDEVRAAVADATSSLDPLVSLVAPLRRTRRAQAQLRGVMARLASRAASDAREGSLLALLRAHDGPWTGDSTAASDQSIDDLLTILLAGHDTITSALTFAWALLSEHPDADRRLHEEVRTVLGDRRATSGDVARLPYARAVLAESLRLFPPAWVLARHAVEPHRFDQYDVPAGAVVLVSQYLLHRDPRFFERPLVFDPDRWLTDRPAPPRFAYFPFGAGSRACIGESFGWMEGVLLLATIAQRWRLRTVSGRFPEVEPRITLRPRWPVVVEVRGREGM